LTKLKASANQDC